ncbi:aldolase/citrate lyase family protein [Microbispora bryophytorum]
MLARIETAEGAAAAEAIAATPGIDGVFVGPSEIAAFMGVRGSRRTTTSSPPSADLRHLHGFANGLELDRQAVNAGIIWAHVIR